MGDKQYEKTLEAAIDAGCPNFVQYYDYVFTNSNGESKTISFYETPSFEKLGEYTKKYGTCTLIMPATMY